MKTSLEAHTFFRMQAAADSVKARKARAADRLAEDRGAAMAEYGLLLALVALVAVGILAFFGGEIVEVFTDAEQTLQDRDATPPPD